MPTAPKQSTSVPTSGGKGNGSCAASGYGAAAKYGSLCVDEDMRLRLEDKLLYSIVTGFKVLPG